MPVNQIREPGSCRSGALQNKVDRYFAHKCFGKWAAPFNIQIIPRLASLDLGLPDLTFSIIQKMKTIILIIISICFGTYSLSAQNELEPKNRKNSINLNVGFAKGFLKDKNYSPLNYTSNNVAIDIGYERAFKNENLLFFSPTFQIGTLHTPVSEFNTSDHYNINLELGYLFKLSKDSSKTDFYIGGQHHSYLDLVFYDGTESITFFGLHSLDVSTRLSKRISDKHILTTNISLPLVGLLARPPYTGWDKYIVEHADNPVPVFFRGDITSLNHFLAFNCNVQYQYEISPFFGLNVEYQFRYYKTNVLKKAIIPSNQITIGAILKF